MTRTTLVALVLQLFWLMPISNGEELRVGAAIVDATPQMFPVLVNGGMLSRSESEVKTPINVRAIVVDDGVDRLALVVVDSCMIPRQLCDEAKALAATKTNIKPDRMMISATHTHTAPSSLACLGTDADPNYVPFLRIKIAEAIQTAEGNLEPARVGWGSADAAEYTALRRWIRRPDRIVEDPFGNKTVRANMHAAQNWDDVIGESGPEDPELSMLSFQALDGRPIALLANFSMHYFSDEKISADYFGLFCNQMQKQLGASSPTGTQPFVAILSHGCSGDIWRRDYTKAEFKNPTIQDYTDGLVSIAIGCYKSIEHKSADDIAMSESRLKLRYRVPDKQRLEWAQKIVTEMGDRLPKDTTEVYAREQLILHERQETEVVVQGIKIGEFGIATTPTETYALTGMKIKLQSPLSKTMVIELANGGDGYIPPPEQHLLGGYNTWAARSAGLEVQAEPKITEAAIEQLELASNSNRQVYQQTRGPKTEEILKLEPKAYWRLDEMAGMRAVDSSGNNFDGIYEPGVVFFLAGPHGDLFCKSEPNRAAHFAGGRLQTRIPNLGNEYALSLWFWNGMPLEGRELTGWILSQGRRDGFAKGSFAVGVGGKGHPGAICIGKSGEEIRYSAATIERWTWNHLALVRDGSKLRVYLNGVELPELTGEWNLLPSDDLGEVFFGGRTDNENNWEGRLDEIALFTRLLTADEVKTLAGGKSKQD